MSVHTVHYSVTYLALFLLYIYLEQDVHSYILSLFISNFLYNFSPDTQLVFQAQKNLLASALHPLQTTFHICLHARHQTWPCLSPRSLTIGLILKDILLQNFKRFSHKAHLLASGSNNGYRSLLKTPVYSQVIHHTEASLNCIKLKFIIVTATLGLLHPWRLMLWSTRNLFIFPEEQGADIECDKYDACSCIQ